MLLKPERKPLSAVLAALIFILLPAIAFTQVDPQSETRDASVGSSTLSDTTPQGESRWGEIPVRDSTSIRLYQSGRPPLWEQALLLPYNVVRFPIWLAGRSTLRTFTLLNSRLGLVKERPGGEKKRPLLGFGLGITAGGLDEFGGEIRLKPAIGRGASSTKLSYMLTTSEYQKAALAFQLGTANQVGFHLRGGYEKRVNTRFFGIGPTSFSDAVSLYTQEGGWAGIGLSMPLARAGVNADLEISYSSIGARGPGDDDSPPLDSVHAAPIGYHDRSEGVAFQLALGHDNTAESGRPNRGGVRRVSATYFSASEDTDSDFWSYSGELQQFLPLWFTRRSLALRAFGSWIDTPSDEIPFQRLQTDAGPYGFRGFEDYRWRDRGILGLTAEYRWPIWASKDIDGPGMDAFLFVDNGQVFGEASEVSAENFRNSLGGGIRLLSSNAFLMRVEYGHSREDEVFRLRVSQPFQFFGDQNHGRIPIPSR